MPASNAAAVEERLWSFLSDEESSLYVVLDGARHELIFPAVHQSDCEFECLYMGELEEDLAEAAPYLVKLVRDKPFTEWLFREGWGGSWGIFILTGADMRDLKRHLRKLLMVYDPENKPVYFRYYDPRVLRNYLPARSEQELATMFGPIQAYLMEDEDPARLCRFIRSEGICRKDAFPC